MSVTAVLVALIALADSPRDAKPKTVEGTLEEVSFWPTSGGKPWFVKVQLTKDESDKTYQIDGSDLNGDPIISVDGKKVTSAEFVKWAVTAKAPVKVRISRGGYLGAVDKAEFWSTKSDKGKK